MAEPAIKARDSIPGKRLALTVCLVCVIAATFWLSSRYPALDEKASMGVDLALDDPISFDPLLDVAGKASFVMKVMATTVNWINTNKQGMLFGVLLAAAFMTLLSLLNRRALQGLFSNTLLGVVVGAPLGVCVNCAAPIARGLHAVGARIETSMAVMVSSPTLNVVVLTMMFSLLPFYMAMIKLVLTLVFLMLIIPVLARYFLPQTNTVSVEKMPLESGYARHVPSNAIPWSTSPGWLQAAVWVARSYVGNLWTITKWTVPLMFLSGLLGAIVVTALPWDSLAGRFPEYSTGVWPLLEIGVVGLIGIFLPVPIAFDVVISATLLAGGMPVKFVMVLLFTLGSFSIYSFFIVWQAISWRAAMVMAVSLLVLGIVGSVGAHQYHRMKMAKQNELIDAFKKQQEALIYTRFFQSGTADRSSTVARELPQGKNDVEILAALRADMVKWEEIVMDQSSDLVFQRTRFRSPATSQGEMFSKRNGKELGLERTDSFPVALKFTTPFYRAWPISSGDVHRDGWVDVLMGSDNGVSLFTNRAGRRFELQRIEIEELRSMYVVNAALVDLNNDGWLDIFLSGYRQGNFVIYNNQGRFEASGFYPLPTSQAPVAHAAGFGDIDQNGGLDIVLGNWTAGVWTRSPPEESRNVILWSSQQGYEPEVLPGTVGETLSVLLSDINNDGNIDLIIGNDFGPPDVYYLGQGNRTLTMVARDQNIVPYSTFDTMSIDSADVDNNLSFEIYLAHITDRSQEQRDRLSIRPVADHCEEIAETESRKRCERNLAVHEIVYVSRKENSAHVCLAIEELDQQAGCIAMRMLRQALQHPRDEGTCEQFPARWDFLAAICRDALKQPVSYSQEQKDSQVPQKRQGNILFAALPDGSFSDRAVDLGIDVTGWTWNAKFADLDNDEWQDLYAVNGSYRSRHRSSNVLFMNENGQKFRRMTAQAGLESYLGAGAYTYLDFDNDGDLDVITVSFDGPVWVHQNNGKNGNALSFEVEDEIGNRSGIGSKIVITYGPDGAHRQIRELKASGGFLSFDAPRAHFGLGNHGGAGSVRILWSTGETSEVTGDFTAGYRYRVKRRRSGS